MNAFLFLLAFACAQTAFAASAVRPPRRSEPARWVPARVAVTTTGELRRDLFDSSRLSIFDRTRAANVASCTTFIGPSPTEEFIDLSSLDALVASSLTIVWARVSASETGFYDGAPGTLYTLEAKAMLKDETAMGSRLPLFLFYPEATIATSSGPICARAFAKGGAPGVGDEVLLFASLDAADAAHSILQVDVRKQLVVLRRLSTAGSRP